MKKTFKILLLSMILVLFSFNISFAASNDINIIIDLKTKNISYETNVNKIQPGMEGDLILKIINIDEDVNYSLEFSDEENKPVNLKFYYNNEEYNSLSEISNCLKNEIRASKIQEFKIKYIWKYETGENEQEILKNDLQDTKDSNISIKDFIFHIKAIAESKIDDEANTIITRLPRTGNDFLLEASAIIPMILIVLIMIITLIIETFIERSNISRRKMILNDEKK